MIARSAIGPFEPERIIPAKENSRRSLTASRLFPENRFGWHFKSMKPTNVSLFTLAALALLSSALRAQTPPAPDSSAASTAAALPDETLHLDRFEVSGIAVEDSVNPLTRPM